MVIYSFGRNTIVAPLALSVNKGVHLSELSNLVDSLNSTRSGGLHLCIYIQIKIRASERSEQANTLETRSFISFA